MKLSDMKRHLATLGHISFRLPDGTRVPAHFHVTEVGLLTRHYMDCGGKERKDAVVNLQLWEAGDYDHRLSAQKLLRIFDISSKVLGDEDLEVEVEYQQGTIGKFGLAFDNGEFLLLAKRTACLAEDACGIPPSQLPPAPQCCTPGKGCC